MRRITLWLLATVTTLVLLFSYRTSTMGSGTSPDVAVGSGSSSSSGSGSGAGAGSSGSSGSGGGTTYTGSVIQTRWGPVQVTITVVGGRITAVAVPVYPDANSRDRQINARALPVLKQETIAAQSADIDTVSGATVTSQGYVQSLQAALDAAHLS